MLVEVYGNDASSERNCRDWVQRFRNGDFDFKDKERSDAPKKFEDEDLESLLDEESCQTLKELSESSFLIPSCTCGVILTYTQVGLLTTFIIIINKRPEFIQVPNSLPQRPNLNS